MVQTVDEVFMKEATGLSIHSAKLGGSPFGAVIVDKNNIVVDRGRRHTY